ncbi:hypothetical protein [Nocardia sp. NPDC058114]|uniref:hypothetical protein n=1 Tax=Nocardia sp. NPDC058114 TaxID=3346346 RepID=UPI0036DDCCD9
MTAPHSITDLRLLRFVSVLGMIPLADVAEFVDIEDFDPAALFDAGGECFAVQSLLGQDVLVLTPTGRAAATTALTDFLAGATGVVRDRIPELLTEFEIVDPACKIAVSEFQRARSAVSAQAVLDFHLAVAGLLRGIVEIWPLWQHYQRMFDYAVRMITEGNHDYVASPRCRSYHTLWHAIHFELRTVSAELQGIGS